MSATESVTPENSTASILDTTFEFPLDFFNESLNGSDDSVHETGRDLLREIPLGIVLTFLCLLTTVGNAMVLHAVRTERRLQSVCI